MEGIKVDIHQIKSIAPKAWADFELYYRTNYPSFASNTSTQLTSLPFDFALGLLLKYFIENGVEWDVSNTEYTQLPETLLEVFESYEKVISHYS